MATTKSSSHAIQQGGSAFQNVLLIILIILGAFQIYFLTGNSINLPGQETNDALGIKKAILELEYEKVGGKEAYDLIAEMQRLTLHSPQNPQNLDAMREYVATLREQSPDGGNLPSGGTTASKTLSAEDQQAILANTYLEGNPEGKIVVVEYSDMECPFCIRHFNETKLQSNLIAQYGDQIAFTLKNHLGVNHEGTEVKAFGALCAGKLGGTSAYSGFYSAVLGGSQMSGPMYPVDQLPKLAEELGLDVSAWQACVDSREMSTRFQAETSEAIRLGMVGTPGILIFNRETGAYATIKGALPLSEFQRHVDQLLAQ